MLLGRLTPVKTQGCCVLAEKGKNLLKDVRALDSIWEARYNRMVCHGEGDYR